MGEPPSYTQSSGNKHTPTLGLVIPLQAVERKERPAAEGRLMQSSCKCRYLHWEPLPQHWLQAKGRKEDGVRLLQVVVAWLSPMASRGSAF